MKIYKRDELLDLEKKPLSFPNVSFLFKKQIIPSLDLLCKTKLSLLNIHKETIPAPVYLCFITNRSCYSKLNRKLCFENQIRISPGLNKEQSNGINCCSKPSILHQMSALPDLINKSDKTSVFKAHIGPLVNNFHWQWIDSCYAFEKTS